MKKKTFFSKDLNYTFESLCLIRGRNFFLLPKIKIICFSYYSKKYKLYLKYKYEDNFFKIK